MVLVALRHLGTPQSRNLVEGGHSLKGSSVHVTLGLFENSSQRRVSLVLGNGCFHDLGVLFVGVLVIKTLLLGVDIKSPIWI